VRVRTLLVPQSHVDVPSRVESIVIFIFVVELKLTLMLCHDRCAMGWGRRDLDVCNESWLSSDTCQLVQYKCERLCLLRCEAVMLVQCHSLSRISLKLRWDSI
jgi:hypothetical protein